MDLSAVIFVVLAVAWAVYLIPKALKHHDEMASDRLVEGHSERVRILARRGRRVDQAIETDPTVEPELQVEEVEIEVVDETHVEKVVHETVEQPAAPRPLPTRAAARRAARNRRRVLLVLLLATAVVGVLAGLAYVPAWSPAIPAGLVLAFLVVARISVRAQQQARRRTTTSAPVAAPTEAVAPHARVEQDAADDVRAETLTAQLAEEGTSAETRQEIEAALADDGSLWDPLPLTLPTYVNKARARRTVRTIELTGMTSSGHDTGDTALAREAEQTAQEQAVEQEQAERRKAAGA